MNVARSVKFHTHAKLILTFLVSGVFLYGSYSFNDKDLDHPFTNIHISASDIQSKTSQEKYTKHAHVYEEHDAQLPAQGNDKNKRRDERETGTKRTNIQHINSLDLKTKKTLSPRYLQDQIYRTPREKMKPEEDKQTTILENYNDDSSPKIGKKTSKDIDFLLEFLNNYEGKKSPDTPKNHENAFMKELGSKNQKQKTFSYYDESSTENMLQARVRNEFKEANNEENIETSLQSEMDNNIEQKIEDRNTRVDYEYHIRKQQKEQEELENKVEEITEEKIIPVDDEFEERLILQYMTTGQVRIGSINRDTKKIERKSEKIENDSFDGVENNSKFKRTLFGIVHSLKKEFGRNNEPVKTTLLNDERNIDTINDSSTHRKRIPHSRTTDKKMTVSKMSEDHVIFSPTETSTTRKKLEKLKAKSTNTTKILHRREPDKILGIGPERKTKENKIKYYIEKILNIEEKAEEHRNEIINDLFENKNNLERSGQGIRNRIFSDSLAENNENFRMYHHAGDEDTRTQSTIRQGFKPRFATQLQGIHEIFLNIKNFDKTFDDRVHLNLSPRVSDQIKTHDSSYYNNEDDDNRGSDKLNDGEENKSEFMEDLIKYLDSEEKFLRLNEDFKATSPLHKNGIVSTPQNSDLDIGESFEVRMADTKHKTETKQDVLSDAYYPHNTLQLNNIGDKNPISKKTKFKGSPKKTSHTTMASRKIRNDTRIPSYVMTNEQTRKCINSTKKFTSTTHWRKLETQYDDVYNGKDMITRAMLPMRFYDHINGIIDSIKSNTESSLKGQMTYIPRYRYTQLKRYDGVKIRTKETPSSKTRVNIVGMMKTTTFVVNSLATTIKLPVTETSKTTDEDPTPEKEIHKSTIETINTNLTNTGPLTSNQYVNLSPSTTNYKVTMEIKCTIKEQIKPTTERPKNTKTHSLGYRSMEETFRGVIKIQQQKEKNEKKSFKELLHSSSSRRIKLLKENSNLLQKISSPEEVITVRSKLGLLQYTTRKNTSQPSTNKPKYVHYITGFFTKMFQPFRRVNRSHSLQISRNLLSKENNTSLLPKIIDNHSNRSQKSNLSKNQKSDLNQMPALMQVKLTTDKGEASAKQNSSLGIIVVAEEETDITFRDKRIAIEENKIQNDKNTANGQIFSAQESAKPYLIKEKGDIGEKTLNPIVVSKLSRKKRYQNGKKQEFRNRGLLSKQQTRKENKQADREPDLNSMTHKTLRILHDATLFRKNLLSVLNYILIHKARYLTPDLYQTLWKIKTALKLRLVPGIDVILDLSNQSPTNLQETFGHIFRSIAQFTHNDFKLAASYWYESIDSHTVDMNQLLDDKTMDNSASVYTKNGGESTSFNTECYRNASDTIEQKRILGDHMIMISGCINQNLISIQTEPQCIFNLLHHLPIQFSTPQYEESLDFIASQHAISSRDMELVFQNLTTEDKAGHSKRKLITRGIYEFMRGLLLHLKTSTRNQKLRAACRVIHDNMRLPNIQTASAPAVYSNWRTLPLFSYLNLVLADPNTPYDLRNTTKNLCEAFKKGNLFSSKVEEQLFPKMYLYLFDSDHEILIAIMERLNYNSNLIDKKYTNDVIRVHAFVIYHETYVVNKITSITDLTIFEQSFYSCHINSTVKMILNRLEEQLNPKINTSNPILTSELFGTNKVPSDPRNVFLLVLNYVLDNLNFDETLKSLINHFFSVYNAAEDEMSGKPYTFSFGNRKDRFNSMVGNNNLLKVNKRKKSLREQNMTKANVKNELKDKCDQKPTTVAAHKKTSCEKIAVLANNQEDSRAFSDRISNKNIPESFQKLNLVKFLEPRRTPKLTRMIVQNPMYSTKNELDTLLTRSKEYSDFIEEKEIMSHYSSKANEDLDKNFKGPRHSLTCVTDMEQNNGNSERTRDHDPSKSKPSLNKEGIQNENTDGLTEEIGTWNIQNTSKEISQLESEIQGIDFVDKYNSREKEIGQHSKNIQTAQPACSRCNQHNDSNKSRAEPGKRILYPDMYTDQVTRNEVIQKILVHDRSKTKIRDISDQAIETSNEYPKTAVNNLPNTRDTFNQDLQRSKKYPYKATLDTLEHKSKYNFDQDLETSNGYPKIISHNINDMRDTFNKIIEVSDGYPYKASRDNLDNIGDSFVQASNEHLNIQTDSPIKTINDYVDIPL